MNGVLNVDKPPGITSHDVVYRVRKIAGQKRVGHAGTLDPAATGVLLVCLGQATRLSDLLAEQGKVYEACLHLGVATTTEDSSGEVISVKDASSVNESMLQAVLENFIGTIQQIPPMVSAVHHNGQRLYELARKGITVEREARSVEIKSIDLIDFTRGPDGSAVLRVQCGKGTYIRTLCADIGDALGVGGHMGELRRTAVGVFDIAHAVPLAKLTSESVSGLMITSSEAVSFLESQSLSDVMLADVLNGKTITGVSTHEQGALLRLLWNEELIALARVTEGNSLAPEKVFPPS